MLQHKGIQELQIQIDTNLDKVETSNRYLQNALDSLVQVSLQNQQGLDLLFLQQGYLYLAYGEECCFYAYHIGIVTQHLDGIQTGIEERKKDLNTNWYKQWFDWFP